MFAPTRPCPAPSSSVPDASKATKRPLMSTGPLVTPKVDLAPFWVWANQDEQTLREPHQGAPKKVWVCNKCGTPCLDGCGRTRCRPCQQTRPFSLVAFAALADA
jgi:hypothetical protein